ncbi:MAG: hypothetical protein AB7F89_19775, partial [Pirellulaceae bacterium]
FSITLLLVGTAHAEMPAEIRKLFDEHVVGDWTTETSFDGQRIVGESSISWNAGGASVTGRGTATDAKGVIHITDLLGWDESSSNLIAQGFDSRGNSWTTRWKQATAGNTKEWVGVGTGTYDGQKWDSPTKIRYYQDGLHYEDTTDGKPFIFVAKRKSASASPASEQLKSLEPMVGNFQFKGSWEDGTPMLGEELSQWVLNKSFVLGHGGFKNRDGSRLDYCYLQGWNPQARQIEMFIVDSNGWLGRRVGTVDSTTKRYSGRQEGLTTDGQSYSFDLEIQLGVQQLEWRGTRMKVGPDSLPNLKMTLQRQ